MSRSGLVRLILQLIIRLINRIAYRPVQPFCYVLLRPHVMLFVAVYHVANKRAFIRQEHAGEVDGVRMPTL